MDDFLKHDIEDIEADTVEEFVDSAIDFIETSGLDENYKELMVRHLYEQIQVFDDDEVEELRIHILEYIFDEEDRNH